MGVVHQLAVVLQLLPLVLWACPVSILAMAM